jgi:hypothetical protein
VAQDRQLAYLSVARPGDPTKASLPADEMLSRHQAKPGDEVVCALNHTDFGDCLCDQRQRCDRTDPRDRGQAAASFVVRA